MICRVAGLKPFLVASQIAAQAFFRGRQPRPGASAIRGLSMVVLLPGRNAGGIDATVVPEVQEVHNGGPVALSPDGFRRKFGMLAHLLQRLAARIDTDAHASGDLAIGHIVSPLALPPAHGRLRCKALCQLFPQSRQTELVKEPSGPATVEE